VAADCAAADPSVVETAVFGARRPAEHDLECIDAASAIARADGGTLFLANLTDLSAAAQARLARLVRDREVIIGSTPVPLDLAVVASIADGSEDGADAVRLRRDLGRHFDRARIVVPPLRQRTEDIPLLVDQLLAAMCRADGVSPPPVTHPAMTLLTAMPWKGNMVELRRAVARLASNAAGGVIQLEDVLTHVRFDGPATPPAPAGTLRDARQQFEREYIALVIRHHRGHIGDAARALGIQRTNLYRKARQLGIAVHAGQLRSGR
jgi:two-component system nitrogen regulation response regulator NtrX